MEAQRLQCLGAAPYQRSAEWQNYANSFIPKTDKTRLWEITFDVPQVLDSGFFPSVLEKGLRSEHALALTLAEMYVQGVSTRKVTVIGERLCDVSISSSQVSQATASLD